MVIVANKTDLDQIREVSSQDGRELAKILKVCSCYYSVASFSSFASSMLYICVANQKIAAYFNF